MAPASGSANSFRIDILIQQFPSTFRYGLGMQTQDVGNQMVTATTNLQRLQPGVETSLLLIEQADEQHYRRFHLV